MPIILATWEAEIWQMEGISVQGHPGQIVCKTPISKITREKWTIGMAQTAGCLLEFKPQFHQKQINK
jgi:hypothetical protein